MGSEEYRTKMSVVIKKRYENTEFRAKHLASVNTQQFRERQSIAQKKAWENPELVAKQSALTKERWRNPEYRAHMLEISKNRWSDPEILSKSSESHKRMWQNPEYRSKRWWKREELIAKHSEIAKRLHSDPEYRERHRNGTKRAWLIPETRAHMSEVMKRRISDSRWYGSVKYYEGSRYCEKWTKELRERVRAYFGYACVECGKTQKRNGKKLSVHHVWYNKQTCCDSSPRSLVPLCKSCHMISNSNREYWSRHYQDIIDIEYNGKCWFTREEMIEFLKNSHKERIQA